MNTAIHAAHNLAWKLAAVVRGVASPALLDSYEPERRPSGERNLLRSRGQLQGVSGVAADLGVVYSSGAVVCEETSELPPVIEPTAPVCVGARAPHVWLDADGERFSTHDLFGHQLVLLTGVDGVAWRDAARRISATLDVPLGAVTIGESTLMDPAGRWLAAYGLDPDGAVLVRPDGHIAWRSTGAAADVVATLEAVARRVLGYAGHDRGMASYGAGPDRRCA
jgi:hypothetical protein